MMCTGRKWKCASARVGWNARAGEDDAAAATVYSAQSVRPSPNPSLARWRQNNRVRPLCGRRRRRRCVCVCVCVRVRVRVVLRGGQIVVVFFEKNFHFHFTFCNTIVFFTIYLYIVLLSKYNAIILS